MKIKLSLIKPFKNEFFNEYIDRNFKDSTIAFKLKNSILNYQFLSDIAINKSDEFSLEEFSDFISNCLKDLRSKNKSTAETSNLIRKIFFSNHNLYHHHYINQVIYKKKINRYGKEVQIDPKRNIEDQINIDCHTSGIYLHYFKEINLETTEYIFLLFSKHPSNEYEWNECKETLELLFGN